MSRPDISASELFWPTADQPQTGWAVCRDLGTNKYFLWSQAVATPEALDGTPKCPPDPVRPAGLDPLCAVFDLSSEIRGAAAPAAMDGAAVGQSRWVAAIESYVRLLEEDSRHAVVLGEAQQAAGFAADSPVQPYGGELAGPMGSHSAHGDPSGYRAEPHRVWAAWPSGTTETARRPWAGS